MKDSPSLRPDNPKGSSILSDGFCDGSVFSPAQVEFYRRLGFEPRNLTLELSLDDVFLE